MLSGSASQVTLFCTDDIPAQRRDEFVRDFYGRIQMRLRIEPHEDHPLRFKARTMLLPDMALTSGAVSPMAWERTAELMADDNDDVILSWNSGGYRFDMPGAGMFETKPGAAAILPLDRRFSITTTESRWTMALQFKRSLLRPLVGHIDDVRPDCIARERPEHRLLFDYLWSITEQALPASLGPLVSRHVIDLLAVSFGAIREGEPPPGVRAARLAEIKQYVARQLRNPALSAEQVSRHFSISARYVRRLFAEERTSFSDYVTERRLDYVHSCLADTRQILRPVADIAFEVGFVEPSTFYRQFRRRYAMTPTDVRQAAVERARGG